jgi:hypothetical protein
MSDSLNGLHREALGARVQRSASAKSVPSADRRSFVFFVPFCSSEKCQTKPSPPAQFNVRGSKFKVFCETKPCAKARQFKVSGSRFNVMRKLRNEPTFGGFDIRFFASWRLGVSHPSRVETDGTLQRG